MARPRSGAALVQRQKEAGRRAQQQEEGLVRGAHGPSLSPLASSWPASSTTNNAVVKAGPPRAVRGHGASTRPHSSGGARRSAIHDTGRPAGEMADGR